MQNVQVALDRVQRRLELVGQHRDEVEANLTALLDELPCLAAQNELRRGLAQAVTKLIRRERLGQEVVGAELGRLDSSLEGGVSGDEQGEHLPALFIHLLQHLEAIYPR